MCPGIALHVQQTSALYLSLLLSLIIEGFISAVAKNPRNSRNLIPVRISDYTLRLSLLFEDFTSIKAFGIPSLMNACQLSESLGTAKTSMPSAFEKAKRSLAMFHESFLVYFGTLFPTAAPSNVR